MPKGRNRNPVKSGKVETQYARQLRRIARHVGDIIRAFPPGDPAVEPVLRRMLSDYATTIGGWAHATASQMLQAVLKQEENAWAERTKGMAASIRREIMSAPTGELMRERLGEQVTLIKSIPLDAAQRVHELTLKGLEDSTRAGEIATEIGRSGEVAASRATLIARTEVARTASLLTEARAVSVGSEGYIWRTAGDSDVRESHDEMEGAFVRWDDPPTLSDGTTTHAGQIYNCRCYPEPVVPEPDAD